MNRKTTRRLALGAILAGVLCAVLWIVARYGPLYGFYLTPPSPKRYAEIAIELMDKQGMNAAGSAWATAKKDAQQALEGIQSYAEAYPVLDALAKKAGGKHSFLLAPGEGTDEEPAQPPRVSCKDGIARIVLPAFSGTSDEAVTYALTVVEALRRMPDVRGAVIDLRGNTGGDMGPMLAALSPLLPDGQPLSFHVRGALLPVTLEGGTVTGGGTPMKLESFKLDGNLPIALLTDGQTASSAEAVLLCFRGLNNARTFGRPTAGYTTCNQVTRLYDGALLAVTLGGEMARTGELFQNTPVVPDVLTDEPEAGALRWLEEMAN